jgi:isopentenyldiphosphate isomerase
MRRRKNGFYVELRKSGTSITQAGLPDFLSSRLPLVAQNLDELFDVVDEQNRVTGQMTRREVHRLKLRHRAVHLLVANRAGRVFLHQRSMQKDLFPGFWDSSAAGHVGAGEDYDETALRELEEEIGCRPAKPPQRLFKIEAREETGQEFVWVYRVEAEGPFVLQPDEIERGDWFTVAEIDRWLVERPQELAPAFAFIWARARGFFK